MSQRLPPLARALLAAALAIGSAHAQGPAPASAGQDNVTIYRCIDATGRLTLQDAPCRKGDRQDVRTMVRPKDAPYRPPAAAPAASPAAPPPQVVVVRSPAPMYECTTPDNARYLSDTPEGNPRWVPAWTLGYPVTEAVTVLRPGSVRVEVDRGHVSGSLQTGGYETAILPTAAGHGAGILVRDACNALPQAEVCDRLVDRRDELRRRFSIAQPSERALLGREERAINARLSQDCR